MSSDPASGAKFSVGSVTRFYVPLLLQGFSQSLAYPLVAGIVTHGEHGVDALTAFSQGQMVMFMIGAIGGGLITTGLVFAKTWMGYVAFKRLNTLMMSALLAVQCVAALPPFSDWLFSGLFALPPELAEIASRTLLYGVVMNGFFFLRNVPMVVLFDNLESAKANYATFIRLVVTFALAVAFPQMGLVGPWWGLAALTFGVGIELVATWLYARPYVARLPNRPQSEGAPSLPSIPRLTLEQFRFTLPLSLGGFLLMLSPLVIAAFVGRTADANDMLAIHYVTIGVANPVAFAALRMQTVAIKFPPEYAGDRRLLAYAVAAGLLLGVVPLAFSTPWLGGWYFGTYQNVPPRIVGTARLAIGIYSLIAVIHAVRARVEGLAALAKRPKAIMAGQIAYTASLFTVCSILLPLGVPGWAMAVTAIFIAPVCVTATIYAVLMSGRRPQ
ncbi:MAG: hypothetical protein IKA69_05780 [Kiritimatiellae bacterium]|nr:hypothetical protein [Kiritimatiellia bacterium]MBR2939547.1 hypothetical protein [Kiritimatiellia bacterium]